MAQNDVRAKPYRRKSEIVMQVFLSFHSMSVVKIENKQKMQKLKLSPILIDRLLSADFTQFCADSCCMSQGVKPIDYG